MRAHYGWGAGINLVPIAGSEPSAADLSGVDLAVTLRPDPRLSVENRYLLSRLLEKGGGNAIFNNHIVRSKWNWQFSPEISLRAILQHDGVLANSARTSLETGKNLNVDFLLTYQVNPGTGLYLGYNGNWQNIDLVPTPTGASTIRTGSFRHDARGLFVKFLYLFRF